ncbi:hypothetical protein K2173_004978 [Erythroxylum novogranatense]|uniref:Uncharacterized protein n=1 Tax=Erythroxylum novogranatense TaxID=1862640 RepID=A0AAV8TB55_9ROSI|nr:hypothetical protein K2173_004978 [Erythroxylum novogranatense]
MEANIYDVNHLGADVLLPPRKRLLAGFKKQTSDSDAALHPPIVASSSSSASPSSPSPTPPSPYQHPPSATPCSPSSIEFQDHLNNLLRSHFNNSHNLSPDQIVDASKSAANAATKAAEAARAAAQEKAIIAAKAVTAAKSALAFVASFPEETAAKERYLKKNKFKKHVQVQLLYEKHQPIENYRGDEELARKLHRDMNSSPRISKNCLNSDLKGHKIKKPKTSQTSEGVRDSNRNMVFGANPSSVCNGHAVAHELDYENSIREVCTIVAGEKDSKYDNSSQLDMDNGVAESNHLKERNLGESGSPGKKRGRLKLKKLPLSHCNFRDQANPKEDSFPKSSPLTVKNTDNATIPNKPLFPAETSAHKLLPIEAAPVWKYQEFKAPACVKQNKVMQS